MVKRSCIAIIGENKQSLDFVAVHYNSIEIREIVTNGDCELAEVGALEYPYGWVCAKNDAGTCYILELLFFGRW